MSNYLLVDCVYICIKSSCKDVVLQLKTHLKSAINAIFFFNSGALTSWSSFFLNVYIHIYQTFDIDVFDFSNQKYINKKKTCGTRGLPRKSYCIAFCINLCNYNYLFILFMQYFFFFDINSSYTFWAWWPIRKQIFLLLNK